MRRLDMNEMIDRMKNMDKKNKVILGATSVAVIGVLAVGGYALSNAGSPVSNNKVSTVMKEDTNKEDSVDKKEESTDTDKKEETKENNKKEESTKKEESKVDTTKNETKKEQTSTSASNSVSNTTTTTKPSTNSSSSSQTTTKPSTSTNSGNTSSSSNSSSQTSKPSTNTSNSSTTQSKPVEQAPVIEQKPVEQTPVVEEKPVTPSWWGEGKSEAEIMKTVTDALVWQNVITGETYYGTVGLKYAWNNDDCSFGGLKLVSNPYGVTLDGGFSGGAYDDSPSTNVRCTYDNWDMGFHGLTYVNIEAPASISWGDVLDMYGIEW